MKLAFRSNKDFWAGLMFAGTGAAAMFIARNYPFGTTLRMGPGYFPTRPGRDTHPVSASTSWSGGSAAMRRSRATGRSGP